MMKLIDSFLIYYPENNLTVLIQGSQVRLVKIWPEHSASAIQAFHTAYGVGAMIGPLIAAPFLSRNANGLIVEVRNDRTHGNTVHSGVLVLEVSTDHIPALRCENLRKESDLALILIKETRLSIPYGGLGVLFSFTLVSMMAAHCVEPVGSEKSHEAAKDADDPPNRKLEVILMILLFFYIAICVNLESAFSSK